MVHKTILSILGSFTLVVLLSASPVWAQAGFQFGQNKVLYKDFDWAVLRTEHFDVHYYPEEEKAAHDAARMAERGYDYLSEVFNHEIKKRIPLILYASLNDFQQTNVVHGILDQGTRGVTEGLKNRVVLPITGSYREFNHVLVHELVHAFQFDLMLNSEIKNNRFNPPLWFVEGMAEYLSVGMDNVTRMWVRDGLLNDKLLTVSQLNRTFDIRVYRLGESLWHYVGETHSKETVGTIFKTAVHTGDVEVAMKKVLGIDSRELTKTWHEYAENLVLPKDSTLQTPDEIAKQLTRQQAYYHRINLVPSVSPDGEHIVYVANKNLKEDIFLLSKDKNGILKEKRLIKGGESKRFETLRYFDTSIGWARDGSRIAFISKSGKDDALYVMNPHTKKINHKFMFDELNGLQSPSFSPEGDQLAFVGISGGISNLYVLNLDNRKLTRLTNDRFAVLHPQWSPDGESIVFITDRGTGADEENLLFGNYDLAVYHITNNAIEMITDLQGSATSPQWSPDGSEIAFVSDHYGIPNIYRIRLADKKIIPVTFLRNGVSGITETTPALSWSANGKVMVFSAFHKDSWHLYRLDLTESPVVWAQQDDDGESSTGSQATSAVVVSSEDSNAGSLTSANSSWLPNIPDPNTLYTDYELEDADSVEQREYKTKLELDAVVVGGSYDRYFGAVGAAQFLFSDMLGNHNFYLSTGLQFTSPLHSDIGLTYFNQGSRINYGIQAFQTSVSFPTFASFNAQQFLRNTYRGVNALASYPFSRFSRIEVFGGLTWVDQDVVVETFNRSGINRETFDRGLFNFAQVGAALVFDNTIYGPLGPASGSRSRFSVETTTNDFQFTNLLADYRRYFRLNPRSVLAWRFMGGASVGRDRQFFGIGGPYTYRGAGTNDLIGTNFIISNLEYRFPMLPFLAPSYDMLSAVTFFDAAAAWGVDVPGFSKEKFLLKDVNSALGVGARLNLGYFLLGFDLAWPTDFQSFGDPVKLFSIGTFF